MNSPPETGSPTAMSTPSSGSPPNEEINFNTTASTSNTSYLSNLTSHITSALTGGSGSGSSSKRRLPGGTSLASASNRDPKSRRRVDAAGSTTSGGGGPVSRSNSVWEGLKGEGKKEKEELLDQAYVDYLRKEIGDPFLEHSGVKG